MREVTRILDQIHQGDPDAASQLLPLVYDELRKLAGTDKQAAELVQLRYFAGLPIREIAEIPGISPRTADRLWAFARAWMHREIEGG